jgi:hypothetical protein
LTKLSRKPAISAGGEGGERQKDARRPDRWRRYRVRPQPDGRGLDQTARSHCFPGGHSREPRGPGRSRGANSCKRPTGSCRSRGDYDPLSGSESRTGAAAERNRRQVLEMEAAGKKRKKNRRERELLANSSQSYYIEQLDMQPLISWVGQTEHLSLWMT